MLWPKLFIAFGLSSAVCLFAEQSAGGMMGGWESLTALGIVAVVLIFIVTKMLPALHKLFIEQSSIFADTIKEMQKNFTEILDKMNERESMRSDAITKMREHCASVNAGKAY